MSRITGEQILSGSVSFDIFPKDENGNISLPANVLLNGVALATQTDIENVMSSFVPVFEKVPYDSDNDVYAISSAPIGDVVVYKNGLAQIPGDDYTMDGQTIKFETQPSDDDVITASYLK